MKQLNVILSGLLVVVLIVLGLGYWWWQGEKAAIDEVGELKKSSADLLIPTTSTPMTIAFELWHPKWELKPSQVPEIESKLSQALADNGLVNAEIKTFIGANIPSMNPGRESIEEIKTIVIDFRSIDQVGAEESVVHTFTFGEEILHQITAGKLKDQELRIPVYVNFDTLEAKGNVKEYLSSLGVLAIEMNALETMPTHEMTNQLTNRFIERNSSGDGVWFELTEESKASSAWEDFWSRVVVKVGAQSCSVASVNCRRTTTTGTCVAGPNAGEPCSDNSECGGITCATTTGCTSLGTGSCYYHSTYNACFPSCDASPLAPDPCNASLSCSLVTGGGGGGGGGTTTWCGDGFCNGVETSITCPTDCPPGSSGGGSSGGGGSTASCPWCTGADQCPAGWDWEANHPACGGLGCCTGGGGGGTTWTPNCDWDLSGPEYPQCKYGEGNSCSPLCISLGGCSGCADGLVGSPCVCPTPTVTSSLSANPTSGEAPLNGVDLIARVTGGTATGSIRYRFACTSSGGYLREFNTTNLTVTATDLCNYPSSGTFTARVEVNRQGIVNTSYVNITVSEPPANNAPTVTITLPSSGASFVKGDDISIAANASDPDGSIVSVRLYVDGSSLGPDFTAPP